MLIDNARRESSQVTKATPVMHVALQVDLFDVG